MLARIIGIVTVFCLAGVSLASDRPGMELSGVISKLDVQGNEAVLAFKGVGKLHRNDPAFKSRHQALALYDAEVRLKLDFRFMETYIKKRYLTSMNKQELIAMLKQAQAKGTEMFVEINTDSIVYANSRCGFGVKRITGSLTLVAEWRSMFDKSIAERHKAFGIDYNAVMKADEVEVDIKKPAGQSKSKPHAAQSTAGGAHAAGEFVAAEFVTATTEAHPTKPAPPDRPKGAHGTPLPADELVKQGTDISLKNKRGETAADRTRQAIDKYAGIINGLER